MTTELIDKCIGIVASGVGAERHRQLGAEPVPEIEALLSQTLASRVGPDRSHDIAFHMTDWVWDAQFLVALHLAPDAFSEEEISDGANNFLVHVPNHLAAAAKLYGHPVSDVWGIGALEADGRNDQA